MNLAIIGRYKHHYFTFDGNYLVLVCGMLQFSLPLPQGGRDAITKNPILREDQLPQKFLYPKTKKKNKQVVSKLFYFSPSAAIIFWLPILILFLNFFLLT